jgi:hypothetical protein
VAVHIFHLVDGWERAAREAVRVLRRGGTFLHCWDEHDDAILNEVTQTWMQMVEDLGGSAQRVGTENPTGVSSWLRAQGLPVEPISLVSWETTATPRAALERITSRLWSRTWNVPDDIFHASTQRLTAWALDRFGVEIDTPYTRVNRFMGHVTHIPER